MGKRVPPTVRGLCTRPKQAAVLTRSSKKFAVARIHARLEMRRKSATPARRKMNDCMNAAAPRPAHSIDDHWLPRIPARFRAGVLADVKNEGSWLEYEIRERTVKIAKKRKTRPRRSCSKWEEPEDFFVVVLDAILNSRKDFGGTLDDFCSAEVGRVTPMTRSVNLPCKQTHAYTARCRI